MQKRQVLCYKILYSVTSYSSVSQCPKSANTSLSVDKTRLIKAINCYPSLAALCSRTFNEHCLIFLQTKNSAHKLRIILGLLGLNVEELHGNLTQLQVREVSIAFTVRFKLHCVF